MALKPGKTFKLSKTTKRMMSFIVDKAQRDSFKRAIISCPIATPTVICKKSVLIKNSFRFSQKIDLFFR